MRNNVVRQAKDWLGYNESNEGHKYIIDTYNAHKPLARGYKVKYTDEWCATFVSAVAIKCGYTAIIPVECSCSKMIALFKELGEWQESDAYTPKAGDIIFYDWEDSGKGDNTGSPNHTGIVEKVSGTTITVIEGNYSQSVKRRYISLNGKYIRGFGVPKYTESSITISMPILSKGSTGNEVKTLQRLLLATGYEMNGYKDDGSFGSATENAVKRFQKDNGLAVDGVIGSASWNKILRGK